MRIILLLLLLIQANYSKAQLSDSLVTGIVTMNNLKLTKEPVTGSKVITKIPRDEKVKIIKKESYNRLKINYKGKVGYVLSVFIRIPNESTYNSKPSFNTKKSSRRTYHRGPKGGCYYYNSKGNKVYVDRSKC